MWFGKYRAMAREAQALEAAANSEAEAVRLQLRADLAKACFSLNNSSRLVRLYRETLLPQARQALQSAEELYRKGEADLAGVLETTATVHNFELARLRATADFYQNVARLEKLLGTAFELRPADEPSSH
jgi:outer membrane protein TolC